MRRTHISGVPTLIVFCAGQFNGFYSAASDYYTHQVGAGYDYHNNYKTDESVKGTYTTEAVTAAVTEWIQTVVTPATKSTAKTFAYVAHEAVHGPLEVPMRFITGECEQIVPVRSVQYNDVQ